MKLKGVALLVAVTLGVAPVWGKTTIGVAHQLTPAEKEVYLKRLKAGEEQLNKLCNSGKLGEKECSELKADLAELKREIETGKVKKAHSSFWCKIPGLREICKLIKDLEGIGQDQ